MKIEEFQKKFEIIGKSKEIRDLVDITMQVAQSDISILITGESGVGKEVFARAVHNYSKRSNKELVSVNCGAIPEGILESELFGHKKGSFTGAIEDRKGYFEIADGGTLFLDEIAEMPLTTQVKLLRVLETQEFIRIGGETVTKVDVRIIAATNKDLQKEVDSKKFRNDLYFRLKAVSLNIPPLRNRIGDIPEFISFFIKNYSANNRIPEPTLTKEAMTVLQNYNWPGNIRELKNVVETATVLSKNGILDVDTFIPLLTVDRLSDELRNLPVHINRPMESLDREFIYRALIEIKKDLMELKSFAEKNQNEFNNIPDDDRNEILPLQTVERQAVEKAFTLSRHSKRKTAQLLGISERTLYRKLREYGLE
jgi:DNA-binding NtrC family response regulator